MPLKCSIWNAQYLPQNAKMHIYRAKQLHQILNVQDMLTDLILLSSFCLLFIAMIFFKKCFFGQATTMKIPSNSDLQYFYNGSLFCMFFHDGCTWYLHFTLLFPHVGELCRTIHKVPKATHKQLSMSSPLSKKHLPIQRN